MTRRATLAIALGLAFASYGLPQEPPAASEAPAQTTSHEAESEGPGIWWKWANFAILAVGLGYLIGKSVPPLFRKQSDEIRSALAEAAKIKQEAVDYASSVEARLENLQAEIQKLRDQAHAEITAESERILRETQHHVQRIREQSVQEIELMTRAAKHELRKYASELAIGLAEERIRFRMNPELEKSLVNGFLSDLHSRVPPQATN